MMNWCLCWQRSPWQNVILHQCFWFANSDTHFWTRNFPLFLQHMCSPFIGYIRRIAAISYGNHKPPRTAKDNAIYSASTADWAVIGYFFDCPEITPHNRNLITCWTSSILSHAKMASENTCNIGDGIAVLYVIPWVISAG